MSPEQITKVLCQVAKRHVSGMDLKHPEDIEVQMTGAMRSAALTITVLQELGIIKKEQ